MFSLFSKNPKEKLIKLLKKRFSKSVSQILIANLKTCYALDCVERKGIEIGASKQSGFPDVPDDFNWPENNGLKLDFILQLNLNEIVNNEMGLPDNGMLYFFLDLRREKFPRKLNEFKVVYLSNWDTLTRQAYDKYNKVEEKALKISKSLTCPGDNSYLLQDIDLTDDVFDELLELEHTIIPELFGGGIYDMGISPEADVIDDWIESYNKENGSQLSAEESTNDFVLLLSFLLDEWGFVDSWVHFGIRQEELENKLFNKSNISFTAS